MDFMFWSSADQLWKQTPAPAQLQGPPAGCPSLDKVGQGSSYGHSWQVPVGEDSDMGSDDVNSYVT